MINFLKEIADVANLPLEEANRVVAVTMLSNRAVMINNYKKILTYNDSHVVLKVVDDELVVDGKDIAIKQLTKQDIYLVGDIARVYFAKEVKKYEDA